MKRLTLALSGALVAIPLIAAIKPASLNRAPAPDYPPLGQLPLMPPTETNPDPGSNPVHPAVRLTDILGSNRALTTFSSLTRLHESTETLLGNGSVNTTVLAPLNSVMDNLPRKPWEDPNELASQGAKVYEGPGGQDRADNNLRRFVEAHLVDTSPWKEGVKAKTLGGREIWWEEKQGKRVIMPDQVEVDRVASQVSNGEIVSTPCRNYICFISFATTQLANVLFGSSGF